MYNPFCIGTQVTGDAYIGRKKEMSDLRKWFNQDFRTKNFSLMGLARIGKSSLVYNTFKDINKNKRDEVYVQVNLREYAETNYIELWKGIIRMLFKELKNKDLISKKQTKAFKAFQEEADTLEWPLFKDAIKDIFEDLNNKDIKVLVVLDEFDHAETLFENKTQYYELIRSLSSDIAYNNLFILIISRKQLHTIEGATYTSSTFHNVFTPMQLTGFSDEDMFAYYETLDKSGISLTGTQKTELEYYAGRNPYLLSILGYHMVDHMEREHKIAINEIFRQDCKMINDHYRDICTYLEADHNLKRLVSAAIGPNINTKVDIQELIALGYLSIIEDSYIAISGYFHLFLRTYYIDLDIWNNVIQLEKALKDLVEIEKLALAQKFNLRGSTINDVEKGILTHTSNILPEDIDRYEYFIAATKRDFNVSSSFFDVMSMNDTIKIIKDSWIDIFKKYYNGDPLKNWDQKLKLCAKARNPLAHGHEENLSEATKNEVNTYCENAIKAISSYNGPSNRCDDDTLLQTLNSIR